MQINLGEESLGLHHVNAVLNQSTIVGIEKRKQKISSAFDFLQKKISHKGAVYYGINTGFGDLCDHRISDEDLNTLQKRLILSHACGTGQMIPENISRLILFSKIENISIGNSGVSLGLVETLVKIYNAGISPVIYELGSLGASGDLAPLAHLALMLLGEGEVWLKGKLITAKDALEKCGIQKYSPVAKEGLALLNGTQFSNSFLLYGLVQGHKLFNLANMTAALSIDAFECLLSPYDARIHIARPHEGQINAAASILSWLEGREKPSGPAHNVQDPYAFRCIPQVHGASFDTIAYTQKTALVELNAVTDNPLIFPDSDGILSGGNFHAQPIALANDFLAIALAELGSISERRTFQLISGERELPSFLSPDPGINSGFMIPQYTAASIVSQNKQLCTPASVDSIVSSNGQEDHVSMAANAGTKLAKVADNVMRVIAIEWMTAAQAFSFRQPRNSSPRLMQVLEDYRKVVPRLEEDRLLAKDIADTVTFLQNLNITE